jgi:acetylornithine/N-succinyldiaminopimelate aminotransferase
MTTDTAVSPILPTYARYPVTFERGEGCWLIATDGRRYLDFGAGIAVCSLGHAHPHLVKALQDQAAKLWHTSNLYAIPGQEALARRLVESSFAHQVFFSNSGVEALEGSIKLARRYQYVTGHPERWRVITVEGAFHGRSLATIAAANNPKYLKGFGPKVEGFDTVPFGNMNALRSAIGEETAAILVEPVQGEGGIRAASLDYLRALRAAADEYGLMLIFDEVQCGAGRTGKLWAHEWAGMAPDILAAAKGIGSGFPMGAILANEKAAQGFEPGVHGTTFGGNPLAMAVGNAVLDVMMAPGFLDGVDRVARLFWAELEALVARHRDIYADARGAGLMLGLKCVVPNGEVVSALLKEGLLVVPAAENVIRILPPLVLTEAEMRQGVAILEKVAAAWPKPQAGAA